MQKSSSEIFVGGLVSFSANVFGVFWALGWLFIGGLGVGMSSAPAEDLRQIWSSFMWLALCCPVVINIVLLGVAMVRRRLKWGIGWLVGLLAAGLVAGCLVGLVAAYLAFLNCYPGGPGAPSHC
jgi:hypothetical protein